MCCPWDDSENGILQMPFLLFSFQSKQIIHFSVLRQKAGNIFNQQLQKANNTK